MNQYQTQTQNQTQFSVFIPYSNPELSDTFIANEFQESQIGDVSHIDRVNKLDRNGKPQQSIYVHFDNIYDEQNQYVIALLNGESRTLYYSDTEFWTLLLNKGKKRPSSQRKIRLDLNTDTNTDTNTNTNTNTDTENDNDTSFVIAPTLSNNSFPLAPTLPPQLPSFNCIASDYVELLEKHIVELESKNSKLNTKNLKLKESIDEIEEKTEYSNQDIEKKDTIIRHLRLELAKTKKDLTEKMGSMYSKWCQNSEQLERQIDENKKLSSQLSAFKTILQEKDKNINALIDKISIISSDLDNKYNIIDDLETQLEAAQNAPMWEDAKTIKTEWLENENRRLEQQIIGLKKYINILEEEEEEELLSIKYMNYEIEDINYDINDNINVNINDNDIVDI